MKRWKKYFLEFKDNFWLRYLLVIGILRRDVKINDIEKDRQNRKQKGNKFGKFRNIVQINLNFRMEGNFDIQDIYIF